jgi:hypothetical protein
MARERAHEVLTGLSSGNPVTIVLLGSRPRVLLRNAAYDAERVEAVLKSAGPSEESLNVEVCMEEVERLFREIRSTSRECYLITDAQATTWEKVSDGAKRLLEKIRGSGALLFVPIGSKDSENLAVTRFALASGVLRKNTVNRYVADVRNTGRIPKSNVAVQLFIGKISVDQRVIDTIAPGATESVSLFANFDQPGIFDVSVRIGDDALPLDNTRHSIADIRNTLNVLCVDGDPSDDPTRSETYFLVSALLPEGTGSSQLRVDKVTTADLKISALPTYDIVVLANVPEIVREHALALSDFVKNGGGLFVLLGDKTNGDLMNSRMQDAAGTPLLPAKLMDVVTSAKPAGGEQPASEIGDLDPKIPDHAVTRVFKTMPDAQWTKIRFSEYFKVAPVKEASVLLRLAKSGDPILVEQSLGRGKVLLFTSSADRDWNDMAIHPVYLMMVQQAVTHLTRKPHENPTIVGEPLTFGLPPDVQAKTVAVLNPKGEEISVTVKEDNGSKSAVVTATDYAGVYELTAAANIPGLKAVANVDPQESDIRVLDGGELTAAASRMRARLVGEKESMVAVARESRSGRELWRMLLIFALGALATEAVLSRRFVRRMEYTE